MGAVAKKENHLYDATENSSHGEDQAAFFTALTKSQAMIEFDLNGLASSANENFLKLMGYELADVKGKSHSAFCENTDGAQSAEHKMIWERLSRGECVNGEFKRIGKNGRDVWVIASYTPIMDESSRPYKVVMVATDISGIKAELKVRTDIMNLTSIVSEGDLRGDILSLNDKFCEVSKYTREELIGKPHNTTRHPDMPKEVFKEMWATIGRGKVFRGVVKNRAKDGSPYYVDAVIAPIMGDNGKPKKYLGVRYDITTLETERQNMQAVLKAIDAAYAYIEFDVNGNVLTMNKNFMDVMGYSLEEAKGKQHRVFCDPVYANSPEYAQFWPDLRSGKSKSGIFKRITRSGKEVWLQAAYSPVTDEVGRVIKVLKIATDVSDQQRMIFSIQESATTLSSASDELTATATEMSSNANKTSKESEQAAEPRGHRTGHDDRPDRGDARDGVGAAGQRRVQPLRHLRDDLEADPHRQQEDREEPDEPGRRVLADGLGRAWTMAPLAAGVIAAWIAPFMARRKLIRPSSCCAI